ncbi:MULTISPECIES: 4-hydroxybenzoate 3-monooxygenase [Glutamicibacter]|uniref:4-hydroxybenzoate 3-monooxygenase n=1 Tax=Glutamicibacter arilaitensis (strain DSM 16368 / CIP 108037 / IAM 15318 / JCM 13566 / NCIMB 14258 / Re117) TaxID=861360 RepID=A0ABM9PTT8_GLUAR|nr:MULTISPECIES: 4-hydroxybenzoate 3-monooxygenase [Glutamicibacter]CBT74674.1 4-hydroxybenzoate 3-monooxygenase [Glutamicibacter arilaitensis Re117]HCH48431.1 4-hydroxybenzoate 3-monooxygenase [Glutamicibacter sp.]HCM93294.1 4-hydroxybenzoate 3-monooxygenase [Glutamicibacter sp.]
MVQNPRILKTKVGIIGGGPAGLMLSHLLAKTGIENIVVEMRDHEAIRNTHRAGILEAQAVKMLTESGVDGRVLTHGDEHAGIDLRFNGESHPLDFRDLVDATVTLYAQNEVFVDLAAARQRDQGDVRYSCEVTEILDMETSTPKFRFTDAQGNLFEVHADVIVGADGSRSFARRQMPETLRKDFKVAYPFAWFGILTEAPKSAPELIYANSPHGFALISQRSETVQRMYFQCDPNEDVNAWSDDRIWAELQKRVDGPDNFQLKTGEIFDKTVLSFRSFVREPLSHGRLFLIGDAGHTVPPTGAKGLNLAFADVKVLFEALDSYFSTGSEQLLDGYSDLALKRVWKAQNFSYWMTSMLHTPVGGDPFMAKRALGELETVTSSRFGQQYLAESYTGWPHS